SLIMSEIPAVFPKLRWGFIEASAQWVPWIVHEARGRYLAQGREFPDNVFKEYGIYVTCQTDDDLPYVTKYAGEDNIVIGTDYGHNDTSTEIKALRNIRDTGGVEPRIIDKILDDNARVLYGLN